MNVEQTQNAIALRYLKGLNKACFPPFACHGSVPSAYDCGCHPDIVDRLWSEIGRSLPLDCRGLIYNTPALVHPVTGVILAIGFGTEYGLRLPGYLGVQAIKEGAKATVRWSAGDSMDIQITLGRDWVFGNWISSEVAWCRAAFKVFSLPEDVFVRVRMDFPEQESISILEMLRDLQEENPGLFPDRVLRSVVVVAGGSFGAFADAVALAHVDCASLIWKAESDGLTAKESSHRNLDMPLET